MAKLRLFWAWLDVPSGSVLGVWSGTMILLTIIGFLWPNRFPRFPDGAVTAYIAALGSFAVSKKFGKQETSSSLPVQGEGQ